MIDIAVIGAGPAGYSAAITARKRDQSVVVIGQNTGWLARAEHVANYPGLPDISGRDLLSAMANQAQALGAELRPGVVHQVIAMGDSFALSLGADFIEARRVILCTGARQPKLLPGENELLGRGVSYCGTCDGMLYRDRPVAAVVLGAGFDEDVRFLQGICQVDVLTRPPRALRAEGERVILSTADSDTAYDCVFILRPAVALTTLLPALETADGAVRVDADMQTNIPGVFAAGDITGAPYQAARAVGQGNTAALSIARFLHQGDAINHESTN